MRTFKQRRLLGVILTSLVAVLFVCGIWSYEIALSNTAFLSGWLLLGLMIFLASYNVRKKLTYPPLFKSSTWMQFHIYVGSFSLLVFFFHTHWRIPTGIFESSLYLIFLGLAISGLVGLYFTRMIPSHLAGRGGEVIYERIPKFTKQLREQAEELIVKSVEFNDSTILSDYYQANLASFMAEPRPIGMHLFVFDRVRLKYQEELQALHRYLSEEEQVVAKNLSDVLKLKDDLDFHYGNQGLLKFWLFVHIPLTYSGLLMVLVHVFLIYAFYGGFA